MDHGRPNGRTRLFSHAKTSTRNGRARLQPCRNALAISGVLTSEVTRSPLRLIMRLLGSVDILGKTKAWPYSGWPDLFESSGSERIRRGGACPARCNRATSVQFGRACQQSHANPGRAARAEGSGSCKSFRICTYKKRVGGGGNKLTNTGQFQNGKNYT